MQNLSESEVFRACRTIFGPDLQLNREFLNYLQPAGVRSAYYKQAKNVHPDRFAVSAAAIRARQIKLFQDLNQAHQTVQTFLEQRRRRAPVHQAPTAAPSSYQQRRRQDPPHRPTQSARPLPQRPLQFGQFLYYFGLIPFNTLISAITWQRQQRPLLGQIAQRWGWLDQAAVRDIIESRPSNGKFGERAEQLGLLSSVQVRTLLFHQRTRQQPLGDYFVAQGFFSTHELQQLLFQLAEHNRSYRQGFDNTYYYFHR